MLLQCPHCGSGAQNTEYFDSCFLIQRKEWRVSASICIHEFDRYFIPEKVIRRIEARAPCITTGDSAEATVVSPHGCERANERFEIANDRCEREYEIPINGRKTKWGM